MRRLTAWTATSVLVLCFWLVMFFATGSRQGRIILGVLLAVGVAWCVFRLATYKPEHARGAGSLEDVKRFSRLAPLEEPTQVHGPGGAREEEHDVRKEGFGQGQE